MKKLFILAIIGVSIYYLKPYLFSKAQNGAFDENGNPQTWIFTYNNCGKPCDTAITTLEKRVKYTKFNIDTEMGKQRLSDVGGGNRFPVIVIGDQRIEGSDSMKIISALAEVMGPDTLTYLEQGVMQGHFYEDNSPAVVMYATSWCGYCKQMREYFKNNNIQYTEFDAEGAAKTKYSILKGRGFPLIYIGYRRINGANIKLLEETLDEFNI